MRVLYYTLCLLSIVTTCSTVWAAEATISEATEFCLECHTQATPGIVADWMKSRHHTVSPAQAMQEQGLARKVSAKEVPADLAGVAVGCAECHALNAEAHQDSFDHEGYNVHSVVTPKDCAVCHPIEAEQYNQNKMSRAYGNLTGNTFYQDLAGSINSVPIWENGRLEHQPPDKLTEADSCLHCHGTKIEVTGTITRETDFGDFDIPVLEGWPNQGVGRVNPDGSLGSCAACHTRHEFSMAMARQPYTCSQCHKGPDVPAYKIYQVSKHGNLFSSLKGGWDFKPVPWKAGRDFTAPTCAVCHVSLVVDEEDRVVAQRTHRMNDRLPWRLLGLIYSHPQPKDPDTSIIKNKSGLPLPTELTGEPAIEFLVDAKTREQRTKTMQQVCLACHGRSWVQGHWAKFENSMKTADQTVLAATRIITEAWDQGAAQGPAAGAGLFDEALEKKWIETWLFYANAVRLASAMGGADYGVFDQGRWSSSQALQEMAEWLKIKQALEK